MRAGLEFHRGVHSNRKTTLLLRDRAILAFGSGPAVERGRDRRVRHLADEVVCLAAPEYFQAVGQFYERFDQVEDDEVMCILRTAL